ncbi:MAG: hypothetical protein K8R38_07640 [Verrucomicrobia bacterium]|nr:hypothetical protein [Verrucomicrobiota bacterium]
MKTLRYPLVASALLISFLSMGCATGPKVDPQITAAVASANVNKVTYDKIFNAQTLDYADIMNLVNGRVPSHISVGYLRSTQKVYNFNYAQLAALKSAGAKPHLLNYLTETQGFYGNNQPRKTGSKVPSYVKNNTKLNQDQQPFYYNAPMIDDWYDSAYTESCYSPFSFDTGGGG